MMTSSMSVKFWTYVTRCQELKIPARRVEVGVRSGVAEVAVIVRRRAADVHLDDAGCERCKRLLLSRSGVVQSEDHEVAIVATGAALLSPLPAESNSCAGDTNVSIETY